MKNLYHPDLTILRLKQVLVQTGMSRTSIYRGIRAGTFPKFVPLGARAVGWRQGEIDAWLANPMGYRSQGAA